MAKVQKINADQKWIDAQANAQPSKFVFNLERVPQKSGGVRYGHERFGSVYVPQGLVWDEEKDTFDAHVTITVQRGAH